VKSDDVTKIDKFIFPFLLSQLTPSLRGFVSHVALNDFVDELTGPLDSAKLASLVFKPANFRKMEKRTLYFPMIFREESVA